MRALIFDRPYRTRLRRLSDVAESRTTDAGRSATRIEKQTGLTRPEALELAQRLIQTN